MWTSCVRSRKRRRRLFFYDGRCDPGRGGWIERRGRSVEVRFFNAAESILGGQEIAGAAAEKEGIVNQTWNILCPGMSLKNWAGNPELYRAENVVAVNGAIFEAQLRADYWAVQDVEVVESFYQKAGLGVLNEMAAGTCLWVGDNFEHTAEEEWRGEMDGLLCALERMRVVNHSQWIQADSFCGVAWEVWKEFTFFTAIALALTFQAKEVRVFGADGGRGYFAAGFENDRTDHSARRWEREREIFTGQILPVLKIRGVKINAGDLYADLVQR